MAKMINQQAPFPGIRLRYVFAVVLLCFCSSSCAYYGGGTVGTGLGARSLGTGGITSDVSYFDLSGSVVNSRGLLMPNVRVTAVTSRSTETAVTNELGEFTLPVIAGTGEDITFTLRAGSATAAYIHRGTPANVSAASLTFKLRGTTVAVEDANFFQEE